MADTFRTLSALQALLPDNATEDISAQDVRDFLVSVYPTGKVLLASLTASNSATLDFTSRNAPFQSGNLFQTDFDHYEFHFAQVLPATDNVLFTFRVSSDVGSTWRSTSGDYTYGVCYEIGDNSSNTYNDSSYATTYAAMCDAVNNNHATAGLDGVCGRLTIWRPASAEVHKYFSSVFYMAQSGYFAGERATGAVTAASAIDSIRFLFSSGNITSGTIRVYGVKS